MKTNKSIVFLILLFTGLFSFAQGTAYDLKDIVDMRGSSSERVLEDRGYRLEKVDKSSAGIYQQWWNSRKDQCVTVRLEDGKVRSVVKAPDLDCGKGGSSSHHSSSRDYDDINLSDYRGMQEYRASSKLQDKGYRVKKQYGSNVISMYWHKERGDKCLLMLVKHDEVTSLTKVSSKLCDGDSNTSSNRNYSSHSSRDAKYRDLDGWRAKSAYEVLKSRGFDEIKKHSDGGTTYRIWYRSESRQCVKTVSKDEKISEIFESDSDACPNK